MKATNEKINSPPIEVGARIQKTGVVKEKMIRRSREVMRGNHEKSDSLLKYKNSLNPLRTRKKMEPVRKK